MNCIRIETTIKSRFARVLEVLNQRCSHSVDIDTEEDISENSSTQFLQMQKNQLIDLQENIERYCNTTPVSGLNSAMYDINLVESISLPNLINERDIERTVIKIANQFVSLKFGNIQLLDLLNFLGGATNLDSFLLLTQKTSKTNGFFPYEWFNQPDKLNDKKLLHTKPFTTNYEY